MNSFRAATRVRMAFVGGNGSTREPGGRPGWDAAGLHQRSSKDTFIRGPSAQVIRILEFRP